MSYKDWYTIFEEQQRFKVMKIDPDDHTPQTTNPNRELSNTYFIGKEDKNRAMCTCFAGMNWCRHKKMLVKFQQLNRVNTRWLYNFDKDKWKPPLVNVMVEEP